MMSASQRIEDLAARWLLRREEPDWSAAEQAELDAWLEGSMAHKAAFWRLEHGWREADRIRALGPAAAARTRPRAAIPVWGRLAVAASVAGLLFAGPAILREVQPNTPAAPAVHLQTPVGGHEQVALADGSTVELNTATVIRASVSKKQRDVWLDAGEAFFSVSHSDVPFVVHAGPRVVTVIGTKFSVRRDGENVRVAVLEGRVRVADAATSKAALAAMITRGDMLEAQGSSTLVMQNADARVERALSWRAGMLQFDQTPLIQAAQEFNRYNQRKLVVTGEAGMIPIGGSFKATNAEAFARLLHDAYGLRVQETPTEMKISS